jgi:two-component system cell cycle response regulator DivK
MAAKVLIGDDESVMARIYRDFLAMHGYGVTVAADGAAAVAAAQSKPDVILMDITMPVMDGIEAARVLKSDPSTRIIPLVLYSSAFPAYRDRALAAGCDEFVARPQSPTELLALVARITGKARQ